MSESIGAMRDRIEIQAHDGTKDSAGTLAESGWKEFWSCAAEKLDLNGRELFQSQQVAADVTTQFRIRYRDAITSKMRIVCRDLKYDIAYPVDKDGRRTWLYLLTKRRDA